MSFVAGVGPANFDLLFGGLSHLPAEGEEVNGTSFAQQMGGGVPGTMVQVARLGVPTRLATFLGDGMFSGLVSTTLKESHVEYRNLNKTLEEPVIVSAALITKRDRSFVSYADEICVTDKVLSDVYEYLTGAKIVEMHVEYLEVYKKLKKEGTTLVFDMGTRADMSLETYGKYLEVADYYTPNRMEALRITNTKTISDAKSVLSNYFGDVIIKLDRDGCLLANGNKNLLVSPLENITAVDSTGAGDAFMSGFIYGLYHDKPVVDCIKLGNVAGGKCVEKIGCLASDLQEKELLHLSEGIKVQPYNLKDNK